MIHSKGYVERIVEIVCRHEHIGFAIFEACDSVVDVYLHICNDLVNYAKQNKGEKNNERSE